MTQLHLVPRRPPPKIRVMNDSAAAAQAAPRAVDADRAVAALLAALELRNPGTCRHAERVAALALELTALIRPELAARDGIGHAYLLHDIGKIGLPDAILLKPDRLTESELKIVQTHPRLGAGLVRRLRFLSPLVHDVVACHHERWDGRGYPRQLVGPRIPLAARIFAVVDAFDAMTHTRPYRAAMPVEDALEELARCAGTQFDPLVVSTFLSAVSAATRPVFLRSA
jgi:HD-GYP domain-containing protein (c-di-GMP phosphodiesterase class II)